MDHDTHSPSSTRLPLDGGHADVDSLAGTVELTVRLGDRALLGLSLTADEARRIGAALLEAAGR